MEGRRYEPTPLGEFVAVLFADAVVSSPRSRIPYQPVERVNRLLESAERIRGVGTTISESGNLETFCRRVIDTGSAEARTWATAIYGRVRAEARPFDPEELALGGGNEAKRHVEAEWPTVRRSRAGRPRPASRRAVRSTTGRR